MSDGAMRFKNAADGSVEEVSVRVWLWVLLFGGFYFAAQKMWWQAAIWFVLGWLTSWATWLIYPFLAAEIVRHYYTNRGWVELKDAIKPAVLGQQVSQGAGQAPKESNRYGAWSVIFWSLMLVLVLVFFSSQPDKKNIESDGKNNSPIAVEARHKPESDKKVNVVDITNTVQEPLVPPYEINDTDIKDGHKDITIHHKFKLGKRLTKQQVIATYQELNDKKFKSLTLWIGNPVIEGKEIKKSKKTKKAKKEIQPLETGFAICSRYPTTDEVCEIHKEYGADGLIKDKPEREIITLSKYQPPPEDKTDRTAMALVQCQNFVKEKLVSPSTADFPFFDRSMSQYKNQVYLVKSYVDAQNNFGAMIRNNWYCKMQYLQGDEADINNWSLLDLEMY